MIRTTDDQGCVSKLTIPELRFSWALVGFLIGLYVGIVGSMMF